MILKSISDPQVENLIGHSHPIPQKRKEVRFSDQKAKYNFIVAEMIRKSHPKVRRTLLVMVSAIMFTGCGMFAGDKEYIPSPEVLSKYFSKMEKDPVNDSIFRYMERNRLMDLEEFHDHVEEFEKTGEIYNYKKDLNKGNTNDI